MAETRREALQAKKPQQPDVKMGEQEEGNRSAQKAEWYFLQKGKQHGAMYNARVCCQTENLSRLQVDSHSITLATSD